MGEVANDIGFDIDASTLDGRIAQAHWLVDTAIHRFVAPDDDTVIGHPTYASWRTAATSTNGTPS